jgi:hypothetical protein
MDKTKSDSVESSLRMLRTIIENAEDMLTSMPEDMDDCLPVWWTNKLAISSAYLDSLRDYLVFSDKEELTDDESEEDEESEDEGMEEPEEDEDYSEYDDYYMLPPSVRMVRDAS